MEDQPNKGKGGRKPTFSENFKVQVALEYLSGDFSYPQVAKKYELTSGNVMWFVSWYRNNHPIMMTEEPKEPSTSSVGSQDIKALEQKLILAEMKIAALEKVIAIANAEYQTDLKKKAATR